MSPTDESHTDRAKELLRPADEFTNDLRLAVSVAQVEALLAIEDRLRAVEIELMESRRAKYGREI